MRRLILINLFLLFCFVGVAAEEYSVEPVPDLDSLIETVDALPPPLPKEGDLLTLTDCLQLARDNHPTLQASWAQVLQSKASLDQVWALYYPTASLTLTEDFQDTFFSAVDPDSLSSQLGLDRSATANLSVTQTIFDSGARSAQVDAARKALLSQYFTFESAWVSQANSVQAAYLTLVKQEYLLVVSLLDLKRVTANRAAAQRFLEAGTKSLVDVSQAEIQVAQAEGILASRRNSVRVARISLAQTMNVGVETLQERRLEDLLSIDTQLPPFDESLSELESHPKLLAIRAQESSVLSSAEAEKRSLRPSLDLNTSLQAYRQSPVQTGLWDVQLTLTIPLFNPSIRPKMDEFEAEALQARKQAEAAKLELEQDLRTAYSDRQGATERVEAALRQTQTAIINFDLASKRYRAGLTDYTELVNALRFVSVAQSSYVTALADERSAEIDLLQSTGAAAQFSKTYFTRQFEAEIGQELERFRE